MMKSQHCSMVMSKRRRSRKLTPRDVTAWPEYFTHDITSKSSSSTPRRAERSGVAPTAIVPAARAPLSSNYRSNGAARCGDPTPASICRLALIQLPRRQLPRWYTCGRFIASVIPVRLFAPSLSRLFIRCCVLLFVHLSLSLLSTFLFLSCAFCLTAIIVLFFVAADAQSAVPRSAYTAAHDTFAMKNKK